MSGSTNTEFWLTASGMSDPRKRAADTGQKLSANTNPMTTSAKSPYF